MRAPRTLILGITLLALAGAACTPAGTPTTGPTGAGATTAPAATAAGGTASPAATSAATMAPAVTTAPATAAPTTGAGTSAPPAGAISAAFAVFEPNVGGTPTVQGGATLFGMGGQTQVVIGVMSTGTETMAAGIQAGTCDSPTPEIVYRLTDVTSGASSTTVAADLATILASPHVINIFVAGSETESSITCGEIQPIPIP